MSSTVVMDTDSGRVLYENKSHEKRLIASITKILTAIVVLENNDINKEVTVGNEILKMYGTSIYLEVGEKMRVEDLLYGLLLRSGNDSAVALAVATSGSEEKFVELMNKKAKALGMNDSIFSNSHGLDENTKNYSTAYDMAILSKYATQNKIYQKIVATKKYILSTGKKTYLWYNRNKLLNNYEFCTGGKNGYTPSAGKTLVTTATKNNLNLTIVTLNDGDEYTTHKNLYENNFNKYEKYLIVDFYKEIYSVEDFISINSGLSQNYAIMDDLDFEGYVKFHINNFSGKLEGNNHTLKNIELTLAGKNGLFNQMNGSLQNITFDNIYIKTTSSVK